MASRGGQPNTADGKRYAIILGKNVGVFDSPLLDVLARTALNLEGNRRSGLSGSRNEVPGRQAGWLDSRPEGSRCSIDAPWDEAAIRFMIRQITEHRYWQGRALIRQPSPNPHFSSRAHRTRHRP